MAAAIDSMGEVRARCEQRAGSLPVLVAGVRCADGWRVWLTPSAPGSLLLDAATARQVAGELLTYADLCEGRGWQ